jgi:hypothetical protein
VARRVALVTDAWFTGGEAEAAVRTLAGTLALANELRVLAVVSDEGTWRYATVGRLRKTAPGSTSRRAPRLAPGEVARLVDGPFEVEAIVAPPRLGFEGASRVLATLRRAARRRGLQLGFAPERVALPLPDALAAASGEALEHRAIFVRQALEAGGAELAVVCLGLDPAAAAVLGASPRPYRLAWVPVPQEGEPAWLGSLALGADGGLAKAADLLDALGAPSPVVAAAIGTASGRAALALGSVVPLVAHALGEPSPGLPPASYVLVGSAALDRALRPVPGGPEPAFELGRLRTLAERLSLVLDGLSVVVAHGTATVAFERGRMRVVAAECLASRTDLQRLAAHALAVGLVSSGDVLGTTAIEALAAGVPVVACEGSLAAATARMAGAGTSIPTGAALAGATGALRADEALRGRLAERGRCFAAEWFASREAHQRRVDALVDEALGTRASQLPEPGRRR